MRFEQFTRLGQRIDERWRSAHHESRAFTEIAGDSLREFEVDDFDLTEIARRAASRHHVIGKLSHFSDVPLVVFKSPGFFIELLVWHHNTALAIHEHSATGAFRVYEGSSIHAQYRFEETHRINTFARFGRVVAEGTELLVKGDVRAIRAGATGLRHCLFHLDAPSCTIVVRTYGESEDGPQMDYVPPGICLATEWATNDALVKRAHQCVDLVGRLGDEAKFVRTFQTALERLDLFRALYMATYSGVPRAFRTAVLAEAPRRFGEFEETVRSAMELNWLWTDCVDLRRSVHDPLQRFLLAAAATIRDPAALRVVVEHRYPGRDAFELVFDQVRALLADRRLRVAWDAGERDDSLLRSFLRGAPAADSLGAGALALLATDPILRVVQPIARELEAAR